MGDKKELLATVVLILTAIEKTERISQLIRKAIQRFKKR